MSVQRGKKKAPVVIDRGQVPKEGTGRFALNHAQATAQPSGRDQRGTNGP